MKKGLKLSIEEAMALAIQQARLGFGRVSPNPPVGAVILDSAGRCLSFGYHKMHGGLHAEIEALNQIKDKNLLKGAQLIVTLEPCSFHGKTPSCAQTLGQRPFSKIIYGVKDPHPKVNGLGIEMLKKSSIIVEPYQGLLQSSLEELIEIYDYNQKFKRPFAALKIASSLDGKITRTDQKKWITNKLSRKKVSQIRGRYDAVLIGVQTFLKDNPRLNPRHPDFKDAVNQVILLDPEGKSFDFLKDSQLLKVRPASKVIIVTKSSKSKPAGCLVLEQPVNAQGFFDLNPLLKALFKKGIHSVLVEGGARTFSSFMGEFQRLYLFLAPMVIGSQGLSWTSSLEGQASPWPLQSMKSCFLGEDFFITGRKQ